jgi:hypothetical protein
VADWVDKRVQYIEERPKQSDGDRVFRMAPWQMVRIGNKSFMEPVDYQKAGIANAEKEITSVEFVDEGVFASGGTMGTGGNLGTLRR